MQVKWSKHSTTEIEVCSVRVEGSITHRHADRGDSGHAARGVCVKYSALVCKMGRCLDFTKSTD